MNATTRNARNDGALIGAIRKAGLTFVPPAAGRTGFGGLDCWGAKLDDPQFTDAEGFGRAIDTLDRVEARNVHLGGRFGPVESPNFGVNDEPSASFKAIVSKTSGRVYSVPSADYALVQDDEVFGPLQEAVAAAGVGAVIGRVDGVGTGTTVGHVVLADPEFTVRLLEDYGDSIMLGVRAWNSYNRESSFGGEVFGIRGVCVNYNLWGKLLGRVSTPHRVLDVGIRIAKFEALLETARKSSPVLQKAAERALAAKFKVNEARDVLWGLKLPVRAVNEIDAGFHGLVPDAEAYGGRNGWTLYNAVTAYLTYRPKSGTSLYSTEYYSRQAASLLDASYDSLMAAGQKRRDAWNEAQSARARKATAIKAELLAGAAL
jgi:hypothetical protein